MPSPAIVYLETRTPLALTELVEVLTDIQAIHSACALIELGPDGARQVDLYVTQVRQGSTWIELITEPDTLAAARVVALFVLVIKGAPWIAGLPHQMRARWYESARQAEQAKQAYERL